MLILVATATTAGCAVVGASGAGPSTVGTGAGHTVASSSTIPQPLSAPAVSSASPGSPTAGPTGSAAPAAPTAADRAAGVLSTRFPDRAGDHLRVVPGEVAAPGRGPVVRIRVEVEDGLPIDPARFAGFVMSTLNDPRSWGHGGARSFARTDSGRFDVRVVLASPQLSASICRPLVTHGKLSCRTGDSSVLTVYRWVLAIPDYGSDRTGYRHYVVNHEVGHALGHGHQLCPGRGRPAPVMMQQTKGLLGCTPNPWPFP